MNKKIFFGAFSLTLLSFGAWFIILTNLSPYGSDFYVKLVFFTTLFIWLLGFLSFLIYLLNYLKNKTLPTAGDFWNYSRVAFLLTFIITTLLILQTLRVLTIWDALLLVSAIILIELFVRTRGQKYD